MVSRPARSSVKFGVISHVLPPAASGQAVMLYRMLEGVQAEDYCLISGENYSSENYRESWSVKLPGKYYRLERNALRLDWKGWMKPLVSLVQLTNILLDFVGRVKQIREIIDAEGCQVVIGCTGEFYDFPGAYLASKLAGVGFVAYVFDDYAYQWEGVMPGRYCWLAKRLNKWVIKGADRVIVANKFMQREYKQRYGVECAVIINPGPTGDKGGSGRGEGELELSRGAMNIIYTGAIYRAHYDAFRNLVEAMYLVNNVKAKLHLFTDQEREELEEAGICGPKVVVHKHIPHDEVGDVLRRADVAFLPLAFKSPFPEVIKTSAPGKMGDYLMAGKVVLVHAPEDSYVSWYFGSHECGLVVSDDSSVELARGLERLANDRSFREKLATRAIRRARLDFDPEVAQRKFLRVLEELEEEGK